MNHVTSDAGISASMINHSGHIHHDHSSTSHMHSMSFHFGFNETVLFSFWVVTSPTGSFFSYDRGISGFHYRILHNKMS